MKLEENTFLGITKVRAWSIFTLSMHYTANYVIFTYLRKLYRSTMVMEYSTG